MTMPKYTPLDYQMMSRAIELAKRGIYTTAPNPNVGCVIVNDGNVVGEGFHLRAGEAHAEVHALKMAGQLSIGATAYVTLEPCSHYGRTPPCAEGLIKAKVSKVICAMQDPNPQVSGRGIKMLREAGIEVEVGLLESDAESLNPGFIKRMKTGMPFVQLKMAASVDGQTALGNGKSQWITSPSARHDVQAFRAQAGAILSTAQTVLDDDASLNVRWNDLPNSVRDNYSEGSLRQPLRVILDSRNRLNENLAQRKLKLFAVPGEVALVNGSCSKSDLASQSNTLQNHEDLPNITCPLQTDGRFELSQLLEMMAKDKQVDHVWVEAGSTLAGSLVKQQLVDEIVLYIAPKIMGSDGRGLFGALGFESMQDVVEIEFKDVRQVGKDLRIMATLNYKENELCLQES